MTSFPENSIGLTCGCPCPRPPICHQSKAPEERWHHLFSLLLLHIFSLSMQPDNVKNITKNPKHVIIGIINRVKIIKKWKNHWATDRDPNTVLLMKLSDTDSKMMSLKRFREIQTNIEKIWPIPGNHNVWT